MSKAISMDEGLIVAIDDEEDILHLLEFNLRKEGFELLCHTDGARGLDCVIKRKPDLVLLDLMLPGINGMEICRRIKADERTSHIPVVMLTAKNAEADVVSGLEIGADDYITKPFSSKILAARVKAVLRRHDDEDKLEGKGLVLNLARREVAVEGSPVTLTFSEFEILCLLVRKPGRAFTRSQIVRMVKGDDYPVTERSIDVQIVNLRRKLGPLGANIETIRGVGYRYQD